MVNLEHSWSRRESDWTLSTGNQTREAKLLYLPRTFPPGIRTLTSDWLTLIIISSDWPRTAPEQLRDLFSKFGVLHRLVMPSHCLTAIIEFADPSEAR